MGWKFGNPIGFFSNLRIWNLEILNRLIFIRFLHTFFGSTRFFCSSRAALLSTSAQRDLPCTENLLSLHQNPRSSERSEDPSHPSRRSSTCLKLMISTASDAVSPQETQWAPPLWYSMLYEPLVCSCQTWDSSLMMSIYGAWPWRKTCTENITIDISIPISMLAIDKRYMSWLSLKVDNFNQFMEKFLILIGLRKLL